MSECKGCSPNCFPTRDNCWFYTGSSNSELNIEQGDSGKKVVETLIEEVSSLKEKSDSCGKCGSGTSTSNTSDSNIDSNISLVSPVTCGGTSTDSRKSSNPVSIKTVPTTTGVNVEYDVETIIPEGARVISSRICVDGTKNGYASRIAESSSTVGAFRLSPDNFDANLDIDVRFQTEAGEEQYKGVFPLSPKGQEDSVFLNGGTANNKVANTQQEANTTFDNCIKDINSQLRAINESNIVNEFYKLRNRIEELESRLADISNESITFSDSCDECSNGTVTKTLKEALSDAASCCCETKQSVRTVTNTVATVRQQVQNIPTTINTISTGTGGGTTITNPPTGSTNVFTCVEGECKSVPENQVNGVNYGSDNTCGGGCGDTTSNICEQYSEGPFTIDNISFNETNSTVSYNVTGTVSGATVSGVQNQGYSCGQEVVTTINVIFNTGEDCTYTRSLGQAPECPEGDPCEGIICPINQVCKNGICECNISASNCGANQTFNLNTCECEDVIIDPCANVTCEANDCLQCNSSGTCESYCGANQTCIDGVCTEIGDPYNYYFLRGCPGTNFENQDIVVRTLSTFISGGVASINGSCFERYNVATIDQYNNNAGDLSSTTASQSFSNCAECTGN